MFVRFRERNSRLLVGVVRSHRVNGKTHQSHIAQLGSVVLPMTIESRLSFWQYAFQKLSQSLSKRLHPEEQEKILNEIQARIPAPTPNEINSIQAERGKSHAAFWKAALDGYEGQIEHYRKIKAHAGRKIRELQKETSKARFQMSNPEKAISSSAPDQARNTAGGSRSPTQKMMCDAEE
jgi:hypothetical protein